MELNRVSLDSGARMVDYSSSGRHPYTKYATMHTNWRKDCRFGNFVCYCEKFV